MYTYNLEYKHAHIVAYYNGQPVLNRGTDTEIEILCSTKEDPFVYSEGTDMEKAKLLLKSVDMPNSSSVIESVISVEYPLIQLLSLEHQLEIKAKNIDKLGKTEVIFSVDIEELNLRFTVEFGELYFRYPVNSEYML